jgi:hypothetical protein
MTNLKGQITQEAMKVDGNTYYVRNTGSKVVPGGNDATSNFLNGIRGLLLRVDDMRGIGTLAIEAHRIPKFRVYCEARGFRVVSA